MKILKPLIFIISAVLIFFLSGCAGPGSTHSVIHYESYHDPYPYWGYGNDRTVIIERPGKPDRPSRPKPPGIGRPKPKPRRR